MTEFQISQAPAFVSVSGDRAGHNSLGAGSIDPGGEVSPVDLGRRAAVATCEGTLRRPSTRMSVRGVPCATTVLSGSARHQLPR
jgi:hypothetical protein